MSLGYLAIITGIFHCSPTWENYWKIDASKIKSLEGNECFYTHLFGFRLNISTNHTLMSIIENIRTRLNDNEFAIGVFVDMKKVFDTVDHEIPIRRLSTMVSETLQRTGSVCIWPIENSLYHLITITLQFRKSWQEFLKAQFLVLFSSLFTSITFITA